MHLGRALRHPRAWNIALRTAHIAAGGALFGGHVFDVGPERLAAWLWVTLLTGIVLVLLEVRHGGRWPAEVRGAMVLVKLLLLCLLPWLWGYRVGLLAAVIVLGSVGSHMPKRLRHYSLLERRYANPDAGPGAGRSDACRRG